MRRVAVVLLGSLLATTHLSAQSPVQVNSAFLFEDYTFDSGLEYSGVSQISVPLTLSAELGGFGVLTLSSGYTNIDLTASESSEMGDRSLSGIVDTEARLVLNLVPNRLSLVLAGILPTGIEALELEEGPILTALSSQVIGFSTTSLGSGGAAGVGLAGALPLGDLALGIAGSYTRSMEYTPVRGSETEWKPGDELRIRAGFEGTVGENSYLRIAAVFANRRADELGGSEQGGSGNRIHGYVALNQGVGSGSLTLYAFDSYRSAPQIESTAAGAVVLPKGNLLAVGGKFAIAVARETRLIPRVEYRRLTEASTEGLGDGSLEPAGSTFRLGADLRQPLSPRVALVLEANGLFGDVGTFEGGEVGVSGYRGGIHLEIR